MKKGNIFNRKNIGFFLRRTTAAILDTIIALTILCFGAYYFRNSNEIVLYVLLILFAVYTFNVLCEMFFKRTFGMWRMQLEIRTFSPHKFRGLLIRKLINFVEFIFAPLNCILILASKRKINLSEKYSKCFVVNSPSSITTYKNFRQSSVNQFLTAIYIILFLYVYFSFIYIFFVLIAYIYGRIINYSF